MIKPNGTTADFVADAFVMAALIGAQTPKQRRRLANSLLQRAERLVESSRVLLLCDRDPHGAAEGRAEAARIIFDRLADFPPLRDALGRLDRQTVAAIAAMGPEANRR